MQSVRSIGGVNVEVSSRSEVLSRFVSSIRNREKFWLAFANTNLITFANRSSTLHAALRRFHVINDGVGMQLACLARHGEKFPENLNGTDLVPYLLKNASSPVRVFLFGAKPKSVEGAAKALSAYPGVEVCGFRDGYSCWDDMPGLVKEINDSNPDVVLVGLGNPFQELWIARYGSELKAPVTMAVGALFDFLSGTATRAPSLLRRARLEWLHRLVHEPKRLWRRYTVDAMYFFYCVLLKGRGPKPNLEVLLSRMSLEVEALEKTLDNAHSAT